MPCMYVYIYLVTQNGGVVGTEGGRFLAMWPLTKLYHEGSTDRHRWLVSIDLVDRQTSIQIIGQCRVCLYCIYLAIHKIYGISLYIEQKQIAIRYDQVYTQIFGNLAYLQSRSPRAGLWRRLLGNCWKLWLMLIAGNCDWWFLSSRANGRVEPV